MGKYDSMRYLDQNGRKGSVIANQYLSGLRVARDENLVLKDYPTNEEVAKAVQHKVAAATEMARKYRYVSWYAVFVGAYMAILYLQATAYDTGGVVETLKDAFLPSPGVKEMYFKNGDELLDYIENKILLPIWQDPLCGDGVCQRPWEFEAWGRFGCAPDCGVNPNTTRIAINVRADFTDLEVPSRTLMRSATWNLCMRDLERRRKGQPELCWYAQDQTFKNTRENLVRSAVVANGVWYILVKGDFAGRVEGRVLQLVATGNGTQQVELPTVPEWKACNKTNTRRRGRTRSAARRLVETYLKAREHGEEEAQEAVKTSIREIAESWIE